MEYVTIQVGVISIHFEVTNRTDISGQLTERIRVEHIEGDRVRLRWYGIDKGEGLVCGYKVEQSDRRPQYREYDNRMVRYFLSSKFKGNNQEALTHVGDRGF